jgi:glutathione S-transferase
MQLLANTTSPYVRIARMCLIEKGIDIEPTIVDPWADDERLRAANASTRVPTLITDDGTPLTESLLIALWLETTRPPPKHPSLVGVDPKGVLSRAGMAMGVIDAAVHTIIIRKVTAPALFDEMPVGLRRRRSMAEGMERLEALAAAGKFDTSAALQLDVMVVVVALDYLDFRFAQVPWLRPMPALRAVASTFSERPAVARTRPH